MIELRFVGDRSDDVAGVEAKGGSERRECCDKHRDDDFDKIFSVHSCFYFRPRIKLLEMDEGEFQNGVRL